MDHLTPEVTATIGQLYPGYIATVREDGWPTVAPKGSLKVLDETHVYFADVHSPQTIANIKRDPRVCVVFVQPRPALGYRIYGRAEVLVSGDLFDKVHAEYAQRKLTVNHVVKIAIEQVAPLIR